MSAAFSSMIVWSRNDWANCLHLFTTSINDCLVGWSKSALTSLKKVRISSSVCCCLNSFDCCSS